MIGLGDDRSRTVSRAIDDLLKLDLVMFFHQNPETLDNAQGLSIRLGYSASQIAKALVSLVEAGLMVQHGEGERAVFHYTDDPVLREVVDRDYFTRYTVRDERKRLESLLATRGQA